MIVQVRISGKEPLLMKSDRTVNRLDPMTKRISALTSLPSAKKTDEVIEQISDLEWEASLYYDEKLGPYIPSRNLFSMLRDGARFNKRGKEVERAVQILETKVKLEYDGPRTLDGLRRDPRFVYTTTLPQGRVRIMRTRPKFERWSLEFRCFVDDERLDFANIATMVKAAGKYVGLGDSRPQFGTFEPEVKEVPLSSVMG